MITVMYDWKTVYVDDQDHSNPLLGNKKTLFVVIDINSLQKNEGFWGVGELYYIIFLELCSVVGQTYATIMLIECDPLTLTLVLRGYWWLVTWGYSWHVTWHFDWHFDMCESDDMTSARAVQVGQSLSKIERPPIY